MRDNDVGAHGVSARLLREARRGAGLTQTRLAELAHTSQSAIAAYEAGIREPTVPVLARMVAAAGARLELVLVPDPRVLRMADLAGHIAAVDPADEARRLRLVFEFLRSAHDDGYPLGLLVGAEPPPIGDARFDALLAAIAEHLCVQAGEVPPVWVQGANRFLERAWWVSALPSARAAALVHAPASFRRRGVMIDRHDLVAA